MSVECCVPFCEENNRVYHRFPTTNEQQCIIWLGRLGVEQPPQNDYDHYYVCDAHFEKSCHSTSQKELVPGALPTLHLPGPDIVESNNMESLQRWEPEDLDIIMNADSNSVCISVATEVGDEEVARRYSAQNEIDDSDLGVELFRPELTEIVARYAVKSEPEVDEEIILKYPNDDDVIRRYAIEQEDNQMSQEMVHQDPDTGNENRASAEEEEEEDETNQQNPGIVEPVGLEMESSHHSEDDSRDQLQTDDGEAHSEMSDDDADSIQQQDGSDRFSDDEGGIEGDVTSDLFEDSCYDSVDADEAIRTLMNPGCSSTRNHSITVYNLCCDKKFLSSISIDTQQNSSLPSRGMSRRDFINSLAMNAAHPGNIDSRKRPFNTKKFRDKPKLKHTSRNENLLHVIYSLEKMAQDVETYCIGARRSLRKNGSPSNVLRTGAKLKGEVTPLLNGQLCLIKKIRTNVP